MATPCLKTLQRTANCRGPTVRWTAQSAVPGRTLATVHHGSHSLPDAWLTGAGPTLQAQSMVDMPPAMASSGPAIETDHRPPSKETLSLGRTLQTLSSRLPTLFQAPIPPELLSPTISLHLFPSTHSHLPVANGPLAYRTALWASPISFGRIPYFQHAKLRLDILSERILPPPVDRSRLPYPTHTNPSDPAATRFIVRWRTQGKTKNKGTFGDYQGISGMEKPPVDKITEFLGGILKNGERDDQEFNGVFIFEFDAKGRISKHLIEHVDSGENMDQSSRVLTLAEWLMKKAKGEPDHQMVPALCRPCHPRNKWRSSPVYDREA